MRPTTIARVCRKAGLTLLLACGVFCAPAGATLRINEVMASNGSTIADEDGDHEDWIELINFGETPVDLEGWALSDDLANPFLWVFPSVKLESGGTLLVWASGKDRVVEPAGWWRFDEGGGMRVFDGSPNGVHGTLSGDFVFTAGPAGGCALDFGPGGRVDLDREIVLDGEFTVAYWWKTRRPNDYRVLNSRASFDHSIGHRNPTRISLWQPSLDIDLHRAFEPEAWEHFAATRRSSTVTVYRHGVATGTHAWSGSLRPDRFGGLSGGTGWDRYDGKLGEVRLYRSALSPQDVAALAAGSFRGIYHTNFSIAAAGEELLLTRPDGSRADALSPTPVPRDHSFGRLPEHGDDWFFFDEPTPGAPNTAVGYSEILDPPVFSHPGGFHAQPFSLSLTTAEPDATILYTLDGSTPRPEDVGGRTYAYKHHYPQDPGDPFGELLERSVETLVYEQALPITNRTLEANRLSMLASTWHRSPDHYTPQTPIVKATPVRARVFREGALPSPVVTHTYLVDPAGRDRYSLPVITLAVDEDALYGYETGIFCAGIRMDTWRMQHPDAVSQNPPSNYQRSGPEWERSAALEFNDPGAAEAELQQTVGIRTHGGWSRVFPQKSFRLYPRSQYETSHIGFAVFPELPYDAYRRLIIRNSGTENGGTHFRDGLVQAVMGHLRFDTQAYRPSIVFINGEYWGIANIRERYDTHYLARVYGVDPDAVDMLTHLSTVNAGSASHYLETRAFIAEHGLDAPHHYAYIQTRIDIDNFMDYQIANIFARNTDWPGANIDFWRLQTSEHRPDAPYGHDGRWRWMMIDMDFSFGFVGGTTAYTHDTLSFATAPGGTEHPNPAWSTFLLRSFLENRTFREGFINRFADQLNSAFRSERVIAMIDAFQDRLAPEMTEHVHRWRRPSSISGWNGSVNRMRAFAQHRPAHQRQHILDYFDLAGQYELTLNVEDPTQGRLRVNTIDLCSERTPGIPDPAHPWTGIYFLGVPVTVTAVPEPGHHLAGWSDLPEGERPLERRLDPDGDLSVTAHFEPIPRPELLHYWSFNTRTLPPLPDHTHGGGTLMFALGPATEVLYDDGQEFSAANSRLGEPAGEHLRLNNPLGAELAFTLPTTGFQDVVLRYESRRSGLGAGLQQLSYTTNGTAFVDWPKPVGLENEPPELYSFDFSGIPGVNDNPGFGVRITFAEGGGGAAGNNRFDNITLDGWALGANRPPRIEHQPPFQEQVAHSDPLILDLDTLFRDPDGDALHFSVESCRPEVVSPLLDGSHLTLSPGTQGDAVLTLSASDGTHPPVETTLRVLVYPAPHALAGGDYFFGHWSPDAPAGTHPAHMLFLQGDRADPTLDSLLLHPYHVPVEDHHEDDAASIGFPYRLTRRSRLSGLGDDGISLINTGRGRDLGAVLLALDTRGAAGIEVAWTGGTVRANDRIYALRLQARVGLSGSWTDILDAEGRPVEYLRHPEDGHVESLGPAVLPSSLEGHPHVQLRWIHHHVDITDGPRAELRLDDIAIHATEWTLLRYDHWRARHFAPDAPDSGPLDVTGTGDLPNLLRYAFDLAPDVPSAPDAFRIAAKPGQSPVLRFHGEPEKRDLAYQVLGAARLAEWAPMPIFDSRSAGAAEATHADGVFTLPLHPEDPSRFFRLRIRMMDPPAPE